MTAKAFCYTINNPTEEDEQDVIALVGQSRYHIVGREIGENSTPHLQGYVYMDQACRITKITKILRRAHVEKA